MIYKKCVMTIDKNKATLDEDIYLYRLDKNIELYFTIVNNKYRFNKGDMNNIILITNASFFQVRLYKNAEIKYTFAIQPTDGGQAILTITDDLIDDPIEVGDYDFQISLLDEEKTSMISMPIVSKQLHVCEPLVSDDATMGKAILGLSKLATGEIKNAFDSEGNYIREIHQDGDILSASIINKFEEALDTNTKAIKNGTGTSYDDTEIKTDINTIKTDLGTEELTTTAKTVKGAVNEVAAQYKEIANNQPTDLSLDSATNLLQLVNSKGSKLGNGITLPISSGGGTSQYLHIKYSSTGAPQLAGQISDTPNAYIGLCVDTNADSPTNPKNYTWYNWKGDNGDTGATPNLQIGTVTTLESGSNATASITGTTENPVLNLGIPKGDKGDTGASGTGTGGDTETWEKVIETTFGEECYAFTVTQDKDGNPLQLKEGFIFLTVSQPKDTGSNLLYGMGFSNWENSFNGKTNIYSIDLMKNYEFYRAAFYFKVINNYVFTQCLGNVRIGTTAPKYNVFTQPNRFNANTVSNFRVLTNSLEYVDKITVGLDMSTTGLFSADSIMEVWAKC